MAMAAVYTTVNGMILSETRGGTETVYVPDTLGSLVECRDASGTKTYSAEYWPYGEVQTSTGANPCSWGFVGLLGYLIDLANLLYVRARHYRPGYARWQTVDPLWPYRMAYEYANDVPSQYSDPSGLMAWPALRLLPRLLPGIKRLIPKVRKYLPMLPKPTGNWNPRPIEIDCGWPPKVHVRPVYGNYCGPQTEAGEGEPKDEVDACCRIHDECFADYGCKAHNQSFKIECRNCTQDLCACLMHARCGWSPSCWAAKTAFMGYACSPIFGNPMRSLF